MMEGIRGLRAFAALLLLLLGAGDAAAQSPPNPPSGSVWTYQSPTTGPAWVAPGNCVNMVTAGGKATAGFDNTTAFNQAMALGSCVYFPAGTWEFSTQLSYTLSQPGQGMAIYGDGPDATILKWSAGGGIHCIATGARTAFHLRDLALITGATNTGTAFSADWGTTVNVGGASSTIDRVRIDGTPHGGPNYWATNIRLNGVSLVNINSLDSWGLPNDPSSQNIGIDLTAPAANIAVAFNVVNSFFNGSLNGIRYGSYIQGVMIVNTNFVNNVIGVNVTGSAGLSGLSIANSQIDSYSDNIRIDTGAAIPNVMISNNLTFVHTGGNGINILGTVFAIQIQNNQMSASSADNPQAGTGINLTNAGFNGENTIDSTVCINLQNCILLGSTVHNTHVSNTRFAGSSTQLAVINNETGSTNFITGFLNPPFGATHYPYGVAIAAAANNGFGGIRLTLNPGSSGLTSGQIVLASVPGLANQPGLYQIGIIDGTTIDLRGSAYNGTYTCCGSIFVAP